MQTNPYSPPQSNVADVPPLTYLAGDDLPVFFPVSQTKLVVLTLCTLSLYQYYWLYKNWKLVRERDNSDISPFWRTFFSIFYCYQLFDLIRRHRPDLPSAKLAAGPLAAAWIIATLLFNLPDPYWLLGFPGLLFLLPVQQAVNSLNQAVAPAHDPNARFGAWNWVAVAVGGPILLLAIYGTFLGVE